MNNFNSNPANVYYPQALHFDEETGKVSVQSQNLNSQSQNSLNQEQNTTFSQNLSEQQNVSSQQNTPFQQFQNQSSGMNMEKIMSMLKGGNSNDMLSALLSNGMKNGSQQNPMMAQAFSKLLNPTKKSDKPVTHSAQSNTTFEEM